MTSSRTRWSSILLLAGIAWLAVVATTHTFSLWRQMPEKSGAESPTQPPSRRQLLAGAGVGSAVAIASEPAFAYEKFKDPTGEWSLVFPTGYQSSKSSGGMYQFFYRDMIEVLESIGVRIQKTKRKSLDEIGDAKTVAEKLMKEIVPEGAPTDIIKATSKIDKGGRRQDIIEYVYQWKFDDRLAQQLGRRKFQLHNKALVQIEKKKQYLVVISAEERRWKEAGGVLECVIDSFTVTGNGVSA